MLVCFHPGVEAGPALDAVLFCDAEPGGRLPGSFPRSTGHAPNSHLARRTSRPIDPVDDARTGRYLDVLTQPELPFGAGMSYSTFTLGQPQLSASEVQRGGEVVLRVDAGTIGLWVGFDSAHLQQVDRTVR